MLWVESDIITRSHRVFVGEESPALVTEWLDSGVRRLMRADPGEGATELVDEVNGARDPLDVARLLTVWMRVRKLGLGLPLSHLVDLISTRCPGLEDALKQASLRSGACVSCGRHFGCLGNSDCPHPERGDNTRETRSITLHSSINISEAEAARLHADSVARARGIMGELGDD